MLSERRRLVVKSLNPVSRCAEVPPRPPKEEPTPFPSEPKFPPAALQMPQERRETKPIPQLKESLQREPCSSRLEIKLEIVPCGIG